ncbi:MAG: LptF/LptG family permease, partial [Firmicutes bacterium]|nr:LptF/LptG family permease [Bacillota bacterium]
MLRIFPRYLLRQWLVPFFGALLLYGGLILAWELILLSRQIFEMGAPFQWMVPYLLTVVPEVLNMVLPMAAVLGGLLGSQHLSEGSETVAAQGLGVGMTPLLRSWGGLALGILILSSLNSNFLVPKINQFRNTIHVKMTEAAQTRFLRPGSAPHFPPQNPDHALWIDANGEIHWMEA